jgi:hypothetical protein
VKLIRLVAVSGLCLAASHAHSASQVESISAEALGSSVVRISWSASEDASSYDLYLNSAQIQTGITATSVELSSLTADTSYQFFVTACKADGMC